MKRNCFTIFILLLITMPLFGAQKIISDSTFSLKESLADVNPDCPQWILDNQALIEVIYYGFDGKLHRGQIVADFRHAEDIQEIFRIALANRFPIKHACPIVKYGWDDFASMEADNTSGFNYRTIPFSKKLSKHAYGWAIDINTRENPYYTDGKIYPEDASYDAKAPGTLTADHPVVQAFKERGWRWGGNWRSKDYQHFDKSLTKEAASGNKKIYTWPWPVR